MIRGFFQFLLTLAKLFTSFAALLKLVKFAWALLMKLFRRGAVVSALLAPLRV